MPADAEIGTAHILVVDDQEPNVRLLERILERGRLGSIRTTTEPQRVEGLCAEEVPDLILLDLHMPHLDGFALLERLGPLREREGFLPVLVLTADADPGARRRALELGATDFVTKPFDADEVLLRCRNLLRTRALYRQVTDHSRQIEGELSEARSTHDLVMAALDRLRHEATLEEHAATLVEELSRASQFDAFGVLAVDPDRRITPIAIGGTRIFDDIIGRPLSEQRAAAVLEQIGDGKHGVALPRGDDPLDRLIERSQLRSAWYVPITSDDRLIGAFVAAGRGEPAPDTLRGGAGLAYEFGSIASAVLGSGLAARYEEAAVRRTVEAILRERAFWPVFQPVVDIRAGHVIGLEALSRFADGIRPDLRFAEAHRVGLGIQLEEETLAAAVAAADDLPHDAWLSVNVSPELLLDPGRLARVLAASRRPVVVEITEHVAIDDYAPVRRALRSLGPNVRVAIDDAGAGFASFRHVLELEPDFVKIDADLVRGIERDPSRQALVVGMRHFAQETGCTLIAEGVETEDERAMLDALDIRYGQGYLLGRPARAARRRVAGLTASPAGGRGAAASEPSALAAAPRRRARTGSAGGSRRRSPGPRG